MVNKKPKRKRCANQGCRKLAIGNGISNLCPVCDQRKEELEDPFIGLQRLTEVEAERWGRLRAELDTFIAKKESLVYQKDLNTYKELERRKIDLELEEQRIAAWKKLEEERRRLYMVEQQKIDQELADLTEQVPEVGKRYNALTKDIAEKYNVDRNNITIDPDTRVIRELED